MAYQTAIFDLDGTLTDSAPGIMESIKYALAKGGQREMTQDELRSCVGPPLAEQFRLILGVDETESLHLLELYREYFRPKGIYINNLYPDVKAFLQGLREAGVHIMLCTGKPEVFARTVIQHFEIDGFFEDLQAPTLDGRFNDKKDCLGELLKRSAGNVIMIGDRKYDIDAANACKIDSCGVLWGYGTVQELTEHGATRLAQSFDELKSIILS